jgi:hypothetical protein
MSPLNHQYKTLLHNNFVSPVEHNHLEQINDKLSVESIAISVPERRVLRILGPEEVKAAPEGAS